MPVESLSTVGARLQDVRHGSLADDSTIGDLLTRFCCNKCQEKLQAGCPASNANVFASTGVPVAEIDISSVMV